MSSPDSKPLRQSTNGLSPENESSRANSPRPSVKRSRRKSVAVEVPGSKAVLDAGYTYSNPLAMVGELSGPGRRLSVMQGQGNNDSALLAIQQGHKSPGETAKTASPGQLSPTTASARRLNRTASKMVIPTKWGLQKVEPGSMRRIVRSSTVTDSNAGSDPSKTQFNLSAAPAAGQPAPPSAVPSRFVPSHATPPKQPAMNKFLEGNSDVPAEGGKPKIAMTRLAGVTKAVAKFQKQVKEIRKRMGTIAVEGEEGIDEDLLDKASEDLPNYIIHHEGSLRMTWDVLVILVVWYASMVTPAELAFRGDGINANIHVKRMEWVVVLIYSFDILVHFFSSYRESGILVADPKRIVLNYIQGWFILDLLSIVPLHIAIFEFKLLRLLRLLRWAPYFARLESFSFAHRNLLRIVKLVMVTAPCLHWTACIFAAVVNFSSDVSDSPWIPRVQNDDLIADASFRYQTGWYWAFSAFTGYTGFNPNTRSQIILTIVVNIFGIAGFIVVFASVVSVISAFSSKDVVLLDRVAQLKLEMEHLGLPIDLQKRILDHTHYFHERFGLRNNDSLLSELPVFLKKQVTQVLSYELLRKAPIFSECDHLFTAELSKALRPVVCLPGELLIRKGDFATEMFFLTKGTVEVIDANGKVLKQLGQGCYIGEMALLLQTKRQASVRAKTHCDLFVLSKTDYNVVARENPEIHVSLLQMARHRAKANHATLAKSAHSKAKAVIALRDSKVLTPKSPIDGDSRELVSNQDKSEPSCESGVPLQAGSGEGETVDDNAAPKPSVIANPGRQKRQSVTADTAFMQSVS